MSNGWRIRAKIFNALFRRVRASLSQKLIVPSDPSEYRGVSDWEGKHTEAK